MRLARRVQTVAAVVATNALEVEAPGVASDSGLSFQRDNVGLSAAREQKRGAYAGGAGTQNRHPGDAIRRSRAPCFG
jgi:hypothetical protein